MKRVYLLLALFFLCAQAHADNNVLRDQVLASLAKQPQKHFYFVQEKKLAMLDKPLVTEGELLLDDNSHDNAQDKSHTVTWDIRKPYELRYVLTRDTIREIDAQGERTLQVGQNPIAAALTQAMTATFSGQWQGNDKLANITATGTATDWQLQITPLAAELQPLIKTISVAGNEGIISSIIIAESNGDSTNIHLRPLIQK